MYAAVTKSGLGTSDLRTYWDSRMWDAGSQVLDDAKTLGHGDVKTKTPGFCAEFVKYFSHVSARDFDGNLSRDDFTGTFHVLCPSFESRDWCKTLFVL